MKTMITVESLKKKGQKKYLVTTSDGTLTLTEDDIVKYRVLKGSTFSTEEWEEIKKSKAKTDAFGKILNYLSYQERTKKEVVTYLRKLKVNDEDIDVILERLIALDFINDERFAKNLVNSYLNKNIGPRVIKERLNQKGIADKTSQAALKTYTTDAEMEAIKIKIKKIQAQKNTYPVRKQKQLIYDKLMRDGFNAEQVMHILDKTEFVSNHHERLLHDLKKVKAQENDQNKQINKLIQKGYEYQDIKKLLD